MNITQPESVNQTTKFMDQIETREFLRADYDGYVRHLTSADLHARHVNTRMEYTNMIVKAATDFTLEEQRRLRALCRVVDARIEEKAIEPFKEPVYDDMIPVDKVNHVFFENYNSDFSSDEEMMSVDKANDVFLENYDSDSSSDDDEPKPWHIDTEALKNIQWVFAKTSGSVYENGLPHTRAPNVIFLSTHTLLSRDKALAKTLLHEKIHVYQRTYPEKTEVSIANAGYTKTQRLRREVPLIRANPDLNEWIYTDPKKQYMALVYNSDTPANIEDVTGSAEHPYETMAYEWEL